MRALVTGGAGFLGSGLVDRLLAEDHAVDVVDDLSSGSLANLAEARASGGDLRFTRLDVRSPELPAVVARAAPDVVYHLAIPGEVAGSAGSAGVLEGAAGVVLGSLSVIEAARSAGVARIVVALGAAMYGRVEAGALPLRESQPRRPTTPRGVAEAAVAAYLEVYRDLHGLEHATLVLDAAYGPRQDPRADATSVAGVAARLDAGHVVAPDRDLARDMVFVDDAIDALARAMTRGGGLVLHIGTGIATPAADLHATVAGALGLPRSGGTPTGSAAPGGRTALDARRAGIHLGWSPWTPLADGVAATVAAVTARRAGAP